jgi:hypothetical protein
VCCNGNLCVAAEALRALDAHSNIRPCSGRIRHVARRVFHILHRFFRAEIIFRSNAARRYGRDEMDSSQLSRERNGRTRMYRLVQAFNKCPLAAAIACHDNLTDTPPCAQQRRGGGARKLKIVVGVRAFASP